MSGGGCLRGRGGILGRWLRVLLTCMGMGMGVGGGTSAWAHAVSDSYLRVRVEERELRGEWRLALHDLEVAVGLDGNGDGSITWGELKLRRDAVVTYASAQLRVKAGGTVVPLTFETEMQVDPLANGTYAVLRWRAPAAAPVREIALDYQVFFEGNALHRGLALVERGTESQQLVFSPGTTQGTAVFDGGGSAWGFGGFLREGLWHIWIGYDHVLFLLTLLLPSVLRREGGVWVPAERGRAVGLEVLRVVTAFTVAHSVTLSLGAFGWLTMPGRWVEVGIAGSIAVAALNNLFPVAVGRVWMLAFGFGLVHGLGFATVLVDAGLPPVAKTTALLGFNLGVELGQLAIVAVFLPLAFAARRQTWYAARWMPLGSLATILLALHWMWERWRGMA